MLISNTSSDTSFSRWINQKSKSQKYSNHLTDDGWIQYLLDHRKWLRERSVRVILTEATMLRYRYRIRDFLTHIDYARADSDQAFRIINRLHGDIDFNLDLRYVYVPRSTDVSELRKSYNTYKKQMSKVGIDVTQL